MLPTWLTPCKVLTSLSSGIESFTRNFTSVIYQDDCPSILLRIGTKTRLVSFLITSYRWLKRWPSVEFLVLRVVSLSILRKKIESDGPRRERKYPKRSSARWQKKLRGRGSSNS